MSRPKPKILLTHTERETYYTEQVLETFGVYVVCYKGEPINLKISNKIDSSVSPSYKRTSFVGNVGHALNLAKRLNEKFKTKDFTVHEMNIGNQIEK